MPRLSLYKPERGKDYTFIDKTITEMFTVGGTDVFVHKYLGPKNPDEASATADQTKSDIEGLGIELPAANLTGTVAAAMEGYLLNIPSFAISMGNNNPKPNASRNIDASKKNSIIIVFLL